MPVFISKARVDKQNTEVKTIYKSRSNVEVVVKTASFFANDGYGDDDDSAKLTQLTTF